MVETGSEIECDWAGKTDREKRGDSDVAECWDSAAAEVCKRGLRRTTTGEGVLTEGAGAGGNDGRGAAGRMRVASGTRSSDNGRSVAGRRS